MEFQGKATLPVIPLRGVAIMPGEIVHCDVGRKRSLLAMESALSDEGIALFSAQTDQKLVDVGEDDICRVGTVCRIRQVFRIQGDTVHLLVTGVKRARISAFTDDAAYFRAHIEFLEEALPDAPTQEALRRQLSAAFLAHAEKRDRLTQDQRDNVLSQTEFSAFVDGVAQQVLGKWSDRQRVLEEADAEARAMLLLELIQNELVVMDIEARIAGKIKGALERNQKEFVLREQLKAVQEELGAGENEAVAEYRRRAAEKALPDAAREMLERQIERFSELPAGSHEAPMTQSYIELILALPWAERSEDNLDLKHARTVLDRDHYGMEKVKARIIETLAVQKLTNNPQGQILCLVGHGPELRAHEPGRRARRGGDTRTPAHLYRGAAGPRDRGDEEGRYDQSRAAVRRDR
ncbi:MAG: LON peptidase substrate-binding domain-containing protein [Clostridia bacterium]|nr:LON peptidase substrate-binding domain-containing protein [Clostridia bacterium]